MRLNSPRAWVLAARPKTLSGAAVPVMVALSLAWCDLLGTGFRFLPALLCLLFAFIMQIDANLVNDYFDYKKGTDDELRLGPKRACAQGWVTLGAMRRAILITTLAACFVGLPLVVYGGWWMVAIGLLCVAFCFLYTTHLSYIGMGDVLVLVFFGVVPVCCTYYVQLHTITWQVFLASVACGFVIDALLIVNNYRDRYNDEADKKRTLVVIIGADATEWLYLGVGITACLLGLVFWMNSHVIAFVLPFIYLLFHTFTWIKMRRMNYGRQLNQCLGETARNIFIYGLCVTIGLLLL